MVERHIQKLETKQVKNNVLHNLLLLKIRDTNLAEELIRVKEKAEKPNFHDTAQKLFAVTNGHVRKETIAQIQSQEQTHSIGIAKLTKFVFGGATQS